MFEREGLLVGALFGDLDAGGEQLVGAEAFGETLAAEETGGGPDAGQRVRRQHDRGGVPGGLLDRVELAVEMEGVVVEVGAGPVATALGPQELHPAEELLRVLVAADRI